MLTQEALRRRNENRVLGQICYVSNDYLRTVRYLTEKLEIGPWKLLSISDKSAKNMRWNGVPIEEPFKYYIAITRVGGMQIEVIQPGYGPNPYEKFLMEKGSGLHHIKFKVPDNEALAREAALLAGLTGKNILYNGEYGLDRHYYIDTYEELGCYVELGNFPDMPVPPELTGYYPEQ